MAAKKAPQPHQQHLPQRVAIETQRPEIHAQYILHVHPLPVARGDLSLFVHNFYQMERTLAASNV